MYISNQKAGLSKERISYLKRTKLRKISIFVVQILLLAGFFAVWEICADLKMIDSFITSQPSRILKTFANLSSNDLLLHLGVTCYETIVGFLLGACMGTLTAVILWWSPYISKVCEPFLVVLNKIGRAHV